MKMRLRVMFLLSLLLSCIAGCSGQATDDSIDTDETEEHAVQDDASNDEKNIKNDLSHKLLDETITVDGSGKQIVTNPDDVLVVVNKNRNLPADYEPDDLVIPDVPFPYEEDVPKKKMRKEAAAALEQLFQKAETDDIHLFAQSGYRSYERQEAIFAYNAEQRGEEEANKVSAHAGQSEHQTGLTMDVTSPEVAFELVEAFANTKEGKWLKEHAHEFGFIIRYPKEKEELTGYSYEPWHIRYVGKEHAKAMVENGWVLEEYLSSDTNDEKEGHANGENE